MTELVIEATVDTGFNGDLTLPPSIISQLSLPFLEWRSVELADGSIIEVSIHQASIVWDGQVLPIEIHCTNGSPLLGMSLLFGHRLTLDAVENGPVVIEKL